MKSSAPDEHHRGLGAPIRPEPQAKPDQWDMKVSHGKTVWTNRRTGSMQTNSPHVQPPPPVLPPFEHMREILRRAQQEQDEDGYPMSFWGAM